MGGNFVRKRWQNSPPCRDLQTERSHEARGRWMKVDTVSTFWLVSHTVLSVCILILWQYKWYDAEIHAAHSSGFIWLTSSTVQCFPKDLANILRTWGPTIPGSPRSPSGPGSPCRGKEVYNLWNLCITNTQTHTYFWCQPDLRQSVSVCHNFTVKLCWQYIQLFFYGSGFGPSRRCQPTTSTLIDRGEVRTARMCGWTE